MIRRRNLLAMASILGSKGKMHGLLLHNNDQFPFFTKISTFTSLNNSNSRVYMGVFGLNLRNCAAQSGDGDGFYKMRAVAPLQQRLLEIGVQQEERERGSVGDGCGGCERGNGNGNGSSSTGFCSGYSLTEKIVVAVDVDEVLGNFVSALNRFIADRYSSNHSVSEYHVYEFFKIWKCSRDEADIRVHEFFKTPYFKNGIYPIPGAQRTLHKLSRFYNLSIVTSRQNAIKEHTIQWIEKHYPGLFKEIHFGNHFALDGVSRSKSEICRSMGAKVLIDDNPRYAIECANTGMRVLLFDYENSYPWSRADDIHQHPLVTKVHNWDEVERYLLSLVLS